MLHQKLVLSLFISGLCLVAEQIEQKVLLTKEELINLVKKAEENPNLVPSPFYLSYSDVNEKKFSDIVSDEWYEKILECVNNDYSHCMEAANILLAHCENIERNSYWKTWEKYHKKEIKMLGKEFCQEMLTQEKEKYKNKRIHHFYTKMRAFFAFIQGYIMGKNQNKFAFVQGYMLAKDPYIERASKKSDEVQLPE